MAGGRTGRRNSDIRDSMPAHEIQLHLIVSEVLTPETCIQIQECAVNVKMNRGSEKCARRVRKTIPAPSRRISYRAKLLLHLVGTGRAELDEAQVAENLQLLADLVANVGVVGMEFCEFVSLFVDIREDKLGFV